MANPTVEKLKVFGLRHGEKVAMGVVAVIFVACAYFAWSHPSLDITADEVDKTAKAANANINKSQDKNAILQNLEGEGIALAGFEKVVDARQAGTVDASKFKLDKQIVRLEPGAGLIRDTPELIAPTDLYARAGRGAIKILALDESGEFKMKAEEKDKGKAAAKKAETLADIKAKKDEEAEQKRKSKGIAGTVAQKKAEAEAEPEVTASVDDYEQVVKGYRTVTLVGKIDHKKMKELFARALKTEDADPNYLRLDAQKRTLQSDGSWSEWADVDRKAYTDVNSLLTDVEKEIVPKDVLISTLVDRLPFLQAGYWVGVHHAAFVPEEVSNPKPKAAQASQSRRSGMASMLGGDSGGSSSSAYSGGMSSGSYEAGMSSGGSGMGEGAYSGSSSGGGGAAQGDFEKSTAEWLMIRALDFDVKPDTVYRYRVRVVVANPNYRSENVSPGVDVTAKELPGPWSEETRDVNVPADVSTYALRKTPSGADPTGSKIEFQVAKWSQDDGLTVVKKFDQAPGDIIGQRQSTSIPNPKKPEEITTKQYDYTSHQILADALGGERPASEIQPLGANRFETPALALVVRNDGMLVLRDQSLDASNGEMKELADIYEEIMKEVKAPKKKGSSSTMSGMYGSSGGYGAGMGEGQ